MTYIFTIIIVFAFLTELYYNKEKLSNVKKYYFNSFKNWIIAFLLVILVCTIVLLTHDIIPDFLNWGWTNLFYDNTTNIAMSPVNTITKLPSNGLFDFRYIGMLLFFGIFSILLPSLALSEEKMFRENVIDYKQIYINSLKFGFMHMIVGISIFVALILSCVGFVFAIIYRNEYLKNDKDKALTKSTAVHTCYNFILISLLTIIYCISFSN